MEFKKIEWHSNLKDYFISNLPFSLQISVDLRKNGKWRWGFGNAYTEFDCGYVSTLEKAKEKAECKFKEYIERNVKEC